MTKSSGKNIIFVGDFFSKLFMLLRILDVKMRRIKCLLHVFGTPLFFQKLLDHSLADNILDWHLHNYIPIPSASATATIAAADSGHGEAHAALIFLM